jgi:hypothetical protein
MEQHVLLLELYHSNLDRLIIICRPLQGNVRRKMVIILTYNQKREISINDCSCIAIFIPLPNNFSYVLTREMAYSCSGIGWSSTLLKTSMNDNSLDSNCSSPKNITDAHPSSSPLAPLPLHVGGPWLPTISRRGIKVKAAVCGQILIYR